MKRVLGLLLNFVVAFSAAAADTTDSAFVPVVDDPKLPRVLLIGDSISIGYTLPVRERLKGVANVHRIPENSQTTAYVLKHLDKWLDADKSGRKWDVIHFNVGLHDVKRVRGKRQVSPKDYERNLAAIVARLKKTGATLVWASTTPIPPGAAARTPGDETAYNHIAAKIMAAEKHAANDLCAAALEKQSEWQLKANVHFTKAGSAGLAELVAAAIKQALAARATAKDGVRQ